VTRAPKIQDIPKFVPVIISLSTYHNFLCSIHIKFLPLSQADNLSGQMRSFRPRDRNVTKDKSERDRKSMIISLSLSGLFHFNSLFPVSNLSGPRRRRERKRIFLAGSESSFFFLRKTARRWARTLLPKRGNRVGLNYFFGDKVEGVPGDDVT
jgi:hypothetical protein